MMEKNGFVVALTASSPIFDYRATYEASYQITGNGWSCQYAFPNFSGYSPTYSPDISATDDIMESIELGRGVYATSYDNYNYVRTETDWENCAETRYYTATKDWWFGTETYLVSIPLSFSLENGENSSKWTYNGDDIVSSLQSVDWNIAGKWYGDDSSYYSSTHVELSIFNILDMDASGKFPVLLNCNAEHYYASDVLVCCITNDSKSLIRQKSPGAYEINIACLSEEFDKILGGTFLITGYDTFDYDQGVYWKWGSLDGCETELERI